MPDLGSVGVRVTIWVSFAASVVTIFSFLGSIKNGDARWGMGFLACFALIFLGYARAQETRFWRKARYAEVSDKFRLVYSLCVHGAQTEFKERETVRLIARDICNQLAEAFRSITGERCSACIKVLDEVPASGESISVCVHTLCRDSNSENRDGEPNMEHQLDRNTDFLEIFRSAGMPMRSAFFDRDLPARYDYQNTSFDLYGGPPKDIHIWGLRALVRRWTWNLPYKSTMVTAILPMKRPTMPDKGPTLPEKERFPNLVGFLCVDSPRRKTFRKRYDLEWTQDIGKALHPLISKWTEIVETEKGEDIGKRKDNTRV